MPSGSDYFSLNQQGSKVFLPIHSVEKENKKSVGRKNDRGDGQDWVMIGDEFHDALTHQPPENGTITGNHFPENSKHDYDFVDSKSDMYAVHVLCHTVVYIYIFQFTKSIQFKGRICDSVW